MELRETPHQDSLMREVADMAKDGPVAVGLSLYAWPHCTACGQRGRYFDTGYLLKFVFEHAQCAPRDAEAS